MDLTSFLSKFIVHTPQSVSSSSGTFQSTVTGASSSSSHDDYNYMKYTHVSMIHPKQKYFIPKSELDRFWELYGKVYDHHPSLGLLEMSPTDIPVVVDMDVKMEKTTSIFTTCFTPEYIEKVVHMYQTVLMEHFEIKDERRVLCLVLEKEPYVLERNNRLYWKHGFHLHFPKVFMKRWIQEQELIPRVKIAFKRQYDGLMSLDQVLDKGYCRGNGSPWLLYGSRKEVGMDPYRITCVYGYHGQRDENWRQRLTHEGYSIYKHDNGTKIEWDESTLDVHLPRILSLFLASRQEYCTDLKVDAIPLHMIMTKEANTSSVKQLNQDLHRQQRKPVGGLLVGEVSRRRSSSDHEEDDDIVMTMIGELLDILDQRRSRDRNEWMQVGWILFNVCHGSEKGLQKWLEFSQRSPDVYDERTCRWEWSKMKKSDMSIGSLKYIARLDNPDAFHTIMQKYMRTHIHESLSLNGTHNDIAKALFEKYECEYICASLRDKSWYQFKTPVWDMIEEGITLRSKISSEVVLEYQRLAESYLNQNRTSLDKEEQEKCRRKVNTIMKIISQLKSAPYKTNIMKEASEVFYQPGFFRKLDSNPLLFTFQNGVMDLETFEFRDGRPEDYQSMRAPIVYRKDFHDHHPDIQQVENFLVQIFPDKSVREYFLDVSSEVFIGGNSHKIIQIWSGDGDNGKSVTQQLFERMLGPYSIKLPTSLITGRRTQSSSACPELARAGNGVRLAMLQEPDQKDVLNIGILKELSGNDSFFARGLYKEGSEIRPMFKLVLVCNEPPKLPYNDRATWNRIRVIPFESTFSDSAPESFEEQLLLKKFPKDKRFVEKIPGMVEAFAWYLLNRLRRKPKNTAQYEPEKVLLATANYQRRNDIYRQFVDEMITSTDEHQQVSLQEVYGIFKDWFRESVPGGLLPTKTEVRDYLYKIWGEPSLIQGRSIVWKGKSILIHVASPVGIVQPPPDDQHDQEQEVFY